MMVWVENIVINDTQDIDQIVEQVTKAIENADIKAIPRKQYRSISQKLPPNLRHLVRVKRKLVKELNDKPDPHPNKDDIIDEIKNLDEIINNGTDEIIRDDWRKSCDNLNSIKDPKQYWSKFSKLVGTFRTKIYADIKLNNQTATNDQDRADFFATHMSNTCKTPEGEEFNQEHKNNVDKFINTHDSIFKPQTDPNNQTNEFNPDDPEPEINNSSEDNRERK